MGREKGLFVIGVGVLRGILGAGGEPGGVPGGALGTTTAYSLAGTTAPLPELVLGAGLFAHAADLRWFRQ